MTKLGTMGRYLFAAPFLVFGVFHFLNTASMSGMVPFPGGAFWVYLTGVAHIAAAVAIMADWKAAWAGALLGAMLLVFVVSIHVPAVLGAADQAAMQNAMSQLLKDTALAGGAWVVAGAFAVRSAAVLGTKRASEQAPPGEHARHTI